MARHSFDLEVSESKRPSRSELTPPSAGQSRRYRRCWSNRLPSLAETGAVRLQGKLILRLVDHILTPSVPQELLYFDYAPLPEHAAKAINARRVDSLEDMLSQCDIITINAPLHQQTRGLFNKELISKMKPGAWLVNTARGAICDAQAVADAVESGQLGGYAGDVWNVQPAPADHPWRKMKHPLGGGNGMVPHMSGTTIDAQIRYSNGTCLFSNPT
jgi:formate dehydrogenase